MSALLSGQDITIQGGVFNNVHGDYHLHQSRRSEGFDILRRSIAAGAFHDSQDRSNPPKCFPGTREAALSRVMAWVVDEQNTHHVMWIFGPAGTGKSALAQTIAEMCFREGRLAASFFFSGFSAARRQLICTLAYQIAMSIPSVSETPRGGRIGT
ncbi:hypothetical protein M413DRAFT_446966 [Hebeloma cylindrosporum]|uniref:Nephrocystin 3-like N-terminal domain-containing protein n=1 Tax=Hebeloma cylindrosporum TaxID=76867 RepID=A0A0C2YEJ9_HEBCY|nr:hypothetical protein M413DRAFT_446966 [Hebeloma cylindrosporum h7]